ncbi:MAG: major capsid protein [Spirochaetota bacterium]
MAETRIADVVIPEVFTEYMMERALDKNAFFQGGIMERNAQLDSLLSGGGETFNLPFWQDLSGDDEVPSETSDATINKIGTGKQIARRLLRLKAWGANDLAAALAGTDPIEAIGQRVTQYWDSRMQDVLVSTARGVIEDNESNDDGDLVLDISTEDGDNADSSNLISASDTIKAVLRMGDRFDEIQGIAVHSAVYQTMLENDLIDYIRDSEGRLVMRQFLGLTVVVDDRLPRIDGDTSGYKYHNYLFKGGAFAYGESSSGIENTEVDRDPKPGMGVDQLFTRRQFAIHPAGFAWQESSVSGVAPTNSELEDGSNWDRVFEKKNAGVVALISNG